MKGSTIVLIGAGIAYFLLGGKAQGEGGTGGGGGGGLDIPFIPLGGGSPTLDPGVSGTGSFPISDQILAAMAGTEKKASSAVYAPDSPLYTTPTQAAWTGGNPANLPQNIIGNQIFLVEAKKQGTPTFNAFANIPKLSAPTPALSGIIKTFDSSGRLSSVTNYDQMREISSMRAAGTPAGSSGAGIGTSWNPSGAKMSIFGYSDQAKAQGTPTFNAGNRIQKKK